MNLKQFLLPITKSPVRPHVSDRLAKHLARLGYQRLNQFFCDFPRNGSATYRIRR